MDGRKENEGRVKCMLETLSTPPYRAELAALEQGSCCVVGDDDDALFASATFLCLAKGHLITSLLLAAAPSSEAQRTASLGRLSAKLVELGQLIFCFVRSRKPSSNGDNEIAANHYLLYQAGFRQVALPFLDKGYVLLTFQPSLVPNFIDSEATHDKQISNESIREILELFCTKSIFDCTWDKVNVKPALPFTVPGQSQSWPDRIAVVGAGVSGLIAASELLEKGKQVVIFEAANFAGGRIREYSGWPGWGTIAIGGEMVEGENSLVIQMADKHGWPYTEIYEERNWHVAYRSLKKGKTCVWLDGKIVPLWQRGHPGMEEAMKAWDELVIPYCEQVTSSKSTNIDDEPPPDVSISELFAAANISDQACRILNCIIMQTDGIRWSDSSAYMMSDCEMIDLNLQANIASRLEDGHAILLKHFLGVCEERQAEVRLSSAVTNIDYSGDDVKLTVNGSESFTASRAIITVPLPVLKHDAIRFHPPLPLPKQHAIDKMKMSTATKICCRFRRNFWPEEINFLFCETELWSEMWCDNRHVKPSAKRKHKGSSMCQEQRMTARISDCCGQSTLISQPSGEATVQSYLHPRKRISKDGSVVYVSAADITGGDANQRSLEEFEQDLDSCHLVYGFATTDNADRLAKMSNEDLVRTTLKLMQEMVGNKTDSSPTAPGNFVGAFICRWSADYPNVYGGYSSLSVGCAGTHQQLAKPVGDKLFFAGEATHSEVACVDISLQTGLRAAKEVLQACAHEEKGSN